MKPFGDKILSIDIPSGWDANNGNINNLFEPKYLISLGIPKKCSETFKGEHYLGGRFIPPKIINELQLDIPEYQGSSLYMKL
jgi:NAD(P)H-hydrate epimerase